MSVQAHAPETRERSRYSIDLDEPHRAQLAALAKKFKVTQGEVIETMLDRAPHDDVLPANLAAKREAKVARRAPNKDLYKQFKNMTPAQIHAALAAAKALQAEGTSP